MKIDNPIVSGSLIVSGSTTITGYLSASTFVGDGSGLSNMYTDSDTLSYINTLGVVSSSAQLSTEISGAFISTSSSLSSRISVLEEFSSSLDATFATDSELSTVSSSLASNISTNDSRLTTLEGKTLVSSSAQITITESQISDLTHYTDSDTLSYINSLSVVSSSAQLSTEISGAFISTSSSLASNISNNDSRLTTLEGKTLISSSIQLSNQTIPGDLTVGGILTAQEFHTEFVSASIIYDSGSTQFGNSLDDIHNFSGSLAVNTDNLFVSGGRVGIGTTNPISKMEIKENITSNGATIFTITNTGTGNVLSLLANSENTGNPNVALGVNGNVVGSLGWDITNSDLFLWNAEASPSYVGLRLTDEGNTTFHNTTNGATNVIIKNNGTVGIGTTSPTGMLSVVNPQSNSNTWTPANKPDLWVSNAGTSNSYYAFGITTSTGDILSVTNAGNVGIGTNSPVTKLHINGGFENILTVGTIVLGEYDGTTDADIQGLIPGSTFGGILRSRFAGHFVLALKENDPDDSFALVSGGGNWSSDNIYDKVVARFKSNGTVGININSPSYTLHVNGSVAGVGAYVNLSDIDYKKNIYDLTDGLDKVLQLRPVTFNWKNEEYGDRINTGFIAQEVEDVLPNSVITTEDSVKSIATSELIAVLTKAVQELKAEVNELRSEINLLKTNNQ